jgi:hypothetical protein
MNTNKLNDLILDKEFDLAFEDVKKMETEELIDILLTFSFENSSIIYYGFASFMISQKDCAENHYLASVILTSGLTHFKGAYDLAYYHAKKAVELSPSDVSYQEFILLFYNIPEKILPKNEALKFAKNVLDIDSSNQNALNIIQRLE